jgi:citrate/tricarballylate utilization protein
LRGREAAPLSDLIAEAQRVLAICNACRYCEGYCAVFPALERRLTFDTPDVHYLANLCHNCGACLYACQYAPPHEFAVNFPRLLAEVRGETYRTYAVPRALGAAFEHNGAVACIATLCGAVLVIALAVWQAGVPALFAAHRDDSGAFYALLPHGIMATVFGVAGVAVLLALALSYARFWRDTGERTRASLHPAAVAGATADAATLRYLDGGGDGCTYPTAQPSHARRNFHHLTFYGFLLCFAATVAGTFEHYVLGLAAPYPLLSVPVTLGVLGGIGLIVGPAGLLALAARRDPDLADPGQRAMERTFLWLLLATSASGLALLALRETPAMGVVLGAHLALVLALFATLPYGKLVHALYRFAALVRYHLERRRPLPEQAAE